MVRSGPGRNGPGADVCWVVEANPEPIQERQSGNPEGFSNPGEPQRIPIRKKTQSAARKSQSGPGLNHANGYDHDCCGQFGDCGLVATTTATATTTTAAAQRRRRLQRWRWLAMVTITAAMATIAEPMGVSEPTPRPPTDWGFFRVGIRSGSPGMEDSSGLADWRSRIGSPGRSQARVGFGRNRLG